MKPLTVICPTVRDATSMYRGVGPIAHLMDQMPELRINFVESVDWVTLALSSGVFIQRPFTPQHVEMCKIAKMNYKPVWIDYDDDLFGVPMDNPAWGIYGKESTQNQIVACLEMADVISVSTEFLKNKLQSKLKKKAEIRVIPNAFDEVRARKEDRDQTQKLILWRGSHTHVRDLMQYTPEMVKLAHDHPDWTWVFVGFNPWMLAEHFPRGRMIYQEPVDPVHYYKLLSDYRPQITIVPLHECDFNKCKSNIGAIEGSFAGSAVLAPDWDEWKLPGVTNYRDRNTFYYGFKKLVDSTNEQRKALSAKTWGHIEENLMLSQTNKLRAEILRDFFACEYDFRVSLENGKADLSRKISV